MQYGSDPVTLVQLHVCFLDNCSYWQVLRRHKTPIYTLENLFVMPNMILEMQKYLKQKLLFF